MPGSALVGPIVSGRAEPDPALYREIIVDPTARAGQFRWLQDAVEYARARSGATAPWQIRLLPGDYNLGTNRIVLPNYCWLAGSGMHRTRIISSTTVGTDLLDPLINIATTADVRFSDLTVLHTGPMTGVNGGPVALYGGGPADSGPYGVRLVNVRLEGTYAGYYDFSGGHDIGLGANDFETAERTDTTWFDLHGCEVIAHYQTAFRFMRKTIHAFGSKFICDIPASTGDITADAPSAIRIWDFPSRIALFGCDIRLIVRNSIKLAPSSGLQMRVGAIRDDDTGASDVLLKGCRVGLDLSQGDVDQSPGSGGRILVAGINIGGSGATGHHHRIEGTLIEYITPTGGLTSCTAVGGIIVANNSAVVQTNNLSMEGTEIRDLGGAGGTVRKDLIIDRQTGAFKPPGFVHVSGSKVPSLGTTVNTYTLAEWAAVAITPNTINRQRGTATLVAGTVVVTLPVGYPTNCTDYIVIIEPFGDLVTVTKTATTFTVTDITNPAATNTFAWAVFR